MVAEVFLLAVQDMDVVALQEAPIQAVTIAHVTPNEVQKRSDFCPNWHKLAVDKRETLS